MLAMTAAHPTLPIPSYVRVTNVRNGKRVVVRVNDRGPFLQNRLIDLSFAAATKLDYINSGHTQVEVEMIRVDESGDVLDEPVQIASAKVIAMPLLAAKTSSVVISAGGTSPQTAVGTVAAAVVSPLTLNQTVVTAPQDMQKVDPPPSLAAQASKPVVVASAIAPVKPKPANNDDLALVSTNLENTKIESDKAEMAKVEVAKVPAKAIAAGVYLQLGAFSSAENAESLVLKVARSLPALGDQLTVALDGSLHKIRAGPYADGAAASKVADMVQASTGYRPFQVQAQVR